MGTSRPFDLDDLFKYTKAVTAEQDKAGKVLRPGSPVSHYGNMDFLSLPVTDFVANSPKYSLRQHIKNDLFKSSTLTEHQPKPKYTRTVPPVGQYELTMMQLKRKALREGKGSKAYKKYMDVIKDNAYWDHIFHEIFGVDFNSRVDTVHHLDIKDYAVARVLVEVWKNNCGPLTEHFWSKLPYMYDRTVHMKIDRILFFISRIEDICWPIRKERLLLNA